MNSDNRTIPQRERETVEFREASDCEPIILKSHKNECRSWAKKNADTARLIILNCGIWIFTYQGILVVKYNFKVFIIRVYILNTTIKKFVSERFKDEWLRQGLNGATFTHIDPSKFSSEE